MSTERDTESRRPATLTVGLLLAVGLMQMAGDLFGIAPLEGIGAASGASPAPKVFSAVRGLETYSTRFFVEWEDTRGELQRLELTPETYSRLRGPYNRRNVFGAALAYGPVLVESERTRPAFEAVVAYALCGDAPVLRELGIDPSALRGNVRVIYESRPGTDLGDLPREIEAPCP